MALEVARVFVLDCVEEHLNLKLDEVKFTFVSVHGEFEVLFSEDVGGNLSHV